MYILPPKGLVTLHCIFGKLAKLSNIFNSYNIDVPGTCNYKQWNVNSHFNYEISAMHYVLAKLKKQRDVIFTWHEMYTHLHIILPKFPNICCINLCQEHWWIKLEWELPKSCSYFTFNFHAHSSTVISLLHSICLNLHRNQWNFFLNNIYYNICSKNQKGSSRELTLLTFEYFKNTDARQDRTHTHKKAKE